MSTPIDPPWPQWWRERNEAEQSFVAGSLPTVGVVTVDAYDAPNGAGNRIKQVRYDMSVEQDRQDLMDWLTG